MNILLINDSIGVYGGGESVVMNTKRILEEKGHRIVLLGENASTETLASFFRRWFSLKYYFKTKRIIKENNIDIVHINGCSTLISPSPILAARKMNRKVVMTLHTFYYYCPKTWSVNSNYEECQEGHNILCPFHNCPTWKMGIINFPYRLIKWIKSGFHRFLIREYVSHFICPSKKLKEFMQKTFRLSSKKSSYLPNSIKVTNSCKVDFSGAKTNDSQFLFVGRVSKEKGISVAIKAIDILVKEGLKDISLKIIGSGKEGKKLEKLVRELNLEENIKFLGRIDNSKLNRYYQESVAVLMPSICLEAFGLTTIEAMANKTPVIASNIGGITEIVEHNKNGYLFKAGDYVEMSKYMKMFYKNIELSIKLGENGFEKVKREFNEEKYYNNLMKIYLDQK
jgi:glycosyltransferase involved in cell wall biosynthesis